MGTLTDVPVSDVPVNDVPDGGSRGRGGRRRRRPGTLLTMMAGLVIAAAATGCTGADAPPSASTGPAEPTRPAAGSAFTVPPDDQRAIRATLDRVNGTAGGPVAGQQRVLADVVDPGSGAVLRRCPPTTSTLLFEPVYDGLRSAPDWRPTSGTLTGTVYALPVLIRIYTGDRVTGTDLTTLHFGVRNGEAWLTALCVG